MRDDNKRTIREARKVIPKLGELVKTGQTTDDQIAEDVMEGMKTAPADVEKLFSEAKSASNTTRRRLPFSRVSRSDDMYAIYGQLFKVLETTPKTITVQRWLEDKDAKAKTRVKEDTQIPDILIMDIWAFYRMIEYIKAPTPENLLQAQVSMYLARIRGTSLAIRQLLYYKKGQPLGIAESGPTVADRKDNIVEVSKEGFGRRRIGRAFNAASAKLDKMYKGGRISRGQYIAGQKKLAAMLSRI
jgi:hypothetical protein